MVPVLPIPAEQWIKTFLLLLNDSNTYFNMWLTILRDYYEGIPKSCHPDQ